MKKKLFALLAAGLLASTPALAASGAVIAVIDGSRIINESNAGKAAMTELQSLRDAKQKELNAREASLKSLKESLDAKASGMTDEARRAQELKLQREYSDLQILVRDAQEQLKRKEASLMKPINADLDKVINDYAQKNGIDVVLNSSDQVVLKSSERLDITAKILEEYNRYSQAGTKQTTAKPQAKKKK